jgi:DNA-binding CsgD family transcriptional regulator
MAHPGEHAATDAPPLSTRPEPNRTQYALLVSIIDELDYGVMLLENDARLVVSNDSAQEVVRNRRVFTFRDGCLRCIDAEPDRRWRAMLAACDRHGRSLDMFGQGADLLSVAVTPLDRLLSHEQSGRILVTFGRHRNCEPISLRAFARARGLTGAEVSVLEALAAGATPNQIAVDHGVAISTVRTQVRQILGKTGCAGIRDLLWQISRLAPLRPAVRTTAGPHSLLGT